MNKEKKRICRKCEHYYQHYVFTDGKYHWAYMGHCVMPRLKNRRPDDAACEHYMQIDWPADVKPKMKD